MNIVKVGGIVLCGGKSRRMGLPKATLPFGPELMLERVLRLLGEVVEPLVVVAAPDQELPELPANVIVATDQREGRGPLEGLFAGLTAVKGRADAAYATSCDVPLLVLSFVQKMINLLGQHQVVVPVDGGLHHPLAAVYRTSVLPMIEELLEKDQLRPVYLFDQADTLRVPVRELTDVDPTLSTLSNLNQPDDYLAALAKAGFEPPREIVAQLRR